MTCHQDGLDHPTREKFGALETIKELAPKYSQAKADRTMLEHARKSKKAVLMIEAERLGHKTAVLQERYAYSHEDYDTLLKGLHVAVQQEEELRWLLEGARLAIEIWRTKAANARAEHKVF